MGKKARRTRIIPAKTTYRVSLDEFLSQKQLWRKSIAKDGSCLFRAVAEQVYPSQNYYQKARLQCAEYIQSHQDDFKEFLTVPIDEYLTMLRDGKLWGGEVELVALSKLYGRPLVVYNEQEDSVQEQVFPSSEEEDQPTSAEQLQDPILLAYSDGNHYDSVYTKRHKSSTALCQGIVYSILYERVLKDKIPYSCKERLKGLTENDSISSPATDDRALINLRRHYPTESIISMAPQLCRNIAMDVYQRERASIEQRDRHVAASIQFQAGDKCQVRLPEGQLYRGEVTRLDVTPGCHMVYVYECHEEWEVPYKDITLSSSASSVPASARRNTSSYQNGRPPKTQSRPPPPDRVPSQHPHNPPKDTPTPSATSRDSQSTRPHNPPPSTLKDTQPTRTPSAPPRDPLPSRPPPTKSKETRLHPAPSREARKTTGQRRENTEGNSTSASNSSQKFRGEKQAKEVKKVPVKPTVSTPTLDSESFPPLPSSKMAPSSNGSEVVIGKETVPLQATTENKSINPVQNRLGGGTVDLSLHKKGAMRKTTTPGSQVTVTPVQVSLPPVKVPSSSSFPPSGVNLTKTPPGPHGSLTSDDSSYSSSSDESPNGNHPMNATSTSANQNNLVFQFQPFPLPDQLVTGAWETRESKQLDSKRYAREKGDLHKRGSSKEQKTKLKNNSPPISDTGVDEQSIGGRESPYLEPQIPRAKDSSQPEDAWPMIIVESTSPPLPPPSDAANLNMPLPIMMHPTLPSHPTLPPGSHAALITAPIPMVPGPMNETHMQATVSPTMSMIPPQMTVQQLKSVSVSCENHSTQTPSPKLQKKAIQASPEVRSCRTQTESTESRSVCSQTTLHSTVLPADDLKPPPLPKESDMANLRFIISYTAQCLKAYSLYSGESVDGTLAMVEQFEEKGLPNILEDIDGISSASSKEDNPIKLLDSEQQTFIQSLTKLPNLPAHDKKVRHPSKSKKQALVTNSASEPDKLVKPNQEAPKHVVHSQTTAKLPQTKPPSSQNNQELHPQAHMPLPAAATLLQKPPETETKGEDIKPLIQDASKKSSALDKPAEDQERKGESSSLHPMEMLPQQEHAMHPYPPLPHPQMMMAGARPPGIMVGMPMPPVWPYPPHMGIQMVPVYMPPTPFAHQMMPPAASHMMSNQTLAQDHQLEDPEDPTVYELTSESASELLENDQVPKLPSVTVSVGTTLELSAQDVREQGVEQDEPGVYDTQEDNPSEPEQVDDYREYAATDGVEDMQGDLYPKNYPPQEDLSSTLEEARHGSGSESCSEVEHDSQMSTPTSRPETPETTGKQPTLPSLPCRGPSTPTHTHETEAPKKEQSQESKKESKVLRESKLSKASQPPVAPANKEELKGVTELRAEPQKWNKHRFSLKSKGRAQGVGAARGGGANSSGSGKLSGSGRQQKLTLQEGGQPVHSTGHSQGRSFNRDRRAGRTPRQHGGSGGGSGRTTQESTRGVPYSTEDRASHNTSTHLPPFKALFSYALPSSDVDCRDTYKQAQDCSSTSVSQWPWPLGSQDASGDETTYTTPHPSSFFPHKSSARFSSTRQASKPSKDDLRRQLNSESGVLYQWEIEAHYS